MNENTRRDDETTDLPVSGIKETQDFSAGDTRGDGEPFDEQKLPVQLGRYEVTRLLGRGGMGAVYLARDQQLQRDVALKVPKFKSGEHDRATKRFYREARAAATLSHPNLCSIFDVAEIDGVHCIAMAYIKGRSLSDYIDPEKQPNAKAAATIIQKVALAMEEAHQQGILHRDLKPANIMIDHRKEPIVMDFGLACASDAGDESRLTQDGTLIGSPAYMSPEQLKGDPERIGPASDQYALGVVLYELLCGSLPYAHSASTITLLTHILTQPPRPISSMRGDLDQRLQSIVERAIEKDPADRFASMKAFATELAKYVRDMPAGQTSKLQTKEIPAAKTQNPSTAPVTAPLTVPVTAPTKTSQSPTVAAPKENPFENLPPAPAVPPAAATAFRQPAAKASSRSGKSASGISPLLTGAIAGASLLALVGAGAWFIFAQTNPANTESSSAQGTDTAATVSATLSDTDEMSDADSLDAAFPSPRDERPRPRDEQRFFGSRLLAAFDSNGDEILDLDEIPLFEQEEMMVSDANGDGKLDRAELDQIPPRPMRGVAPREGGRNGARPNERDGFGGPRSDGPRGGRTGPGRRGLESGR